MLLTSTPTPGVSLLTLNRPEKRNALNGSLIAALLDALDKIASDSSIRILVLNANGDHFCAGADLAWMQQMAKLSEADNIKDAMQLARLLETLHRFPKPVITLVQGAVMGGGLGLIACADITLAAPGSTFCFSEAKIGLAPSVISPYVIPVIGEKNARYYFLTADNFDAEIALAINLVQQIIPFERLLDTGLMLAQKMLANSPNALREIKHLIPLISGNPLSEKIIQTTAEHLAHLRSSKDAREGLQAFLEKRSPQWE